MLMHTVIQEIHEKNHWGKIMSKLVGGPLLKSIVFTLTLKML